MTVGVAGEAFAVFDAGRGVNRGYARRPPEPAEAPNNCNTQVPVPRRIGWLRRATCTARATRTARRPPPRRARHRRRRLATTTGRSIVGMFGSAPYSTSSFIASTSSAVRRAPERRRSRWTSGEAAVGVAAAAVNSMYQGWLLHSRAFSGSAPGFEQRLHYVEIRGPSDSLHLPAAAGLTSWRLASGVLTAAPERSDAVDARQCSRSRPSSMSCTPATSNCPLMMATGAAACCRRLIVFPVDVRAGVEQSLHRLDVTLARRMVQRRESAKATNQSDKPCGDTAVRRSTSSVIVAGEYLMPARRGRNRSRPESVRE